MFVTAYNVALIFGWVLPAIGSTVLELPQFDNLRKLGSNSL